MAEESAKSKRRMVKKAETVREKTEKSGQPKEKKSSIVRLALGYIATPFRWIGRQFARLGRFLNKFKVFRVIGKVFAFIGRILWPAYFRNSWKELRLVTWPTRRETWQLTLAVIVFSVIFSVIVGVVDFGLDKVFKQLLIK